MKIVEIQKFAETMEGGRSQFFKRIDLEKGQSSGLTVKKAPDGYLSVHLNKRTNRYYSHGFAGLSGEYQMVPPAVEWFRKSGLWPIHAALIERGLAIGYDKVRAAYIAYCAEFDENGSRTESIRAIDPRLVKNRRPDDDLITIMNELPKVVRMDLGRHTGEAVQAIKDRRKNYCTPRVRVGDFEHEMKIDEKDAAHVWYSMEYPGLLNGHYFLAISPTHAVFLESD